MLPRIAMRKALPDNDARAAGMEKIHEAFPQLRASLAAEVISLE